MQRLNLFSGRRLRLRQCINVKYSFQQINLPGDPTFRQEKFVITDATTGPELKDLDLDASAAESNYVIDKKAIWGCGIAVRRNQTKEE